MQTLYRNDSSLPQREIMLAAGVALLLIAGVDAIALWPLFGNDQHVDLMLLLPGSALALIGLKETTGFVKSVDLDANGSILVSLAFRRAELAPASLQRLTIYTSGKDKRRLTLATDSGSFTFPMTAFAADRFAESIKAINPLTVIERRA